MFKEKKAGKLKSWKTEKQNKNLVQIPFSKIYEDLFLNSEGEFSVIPFIYSHSFISC